MPSAPRSQARRKAGSVFSGALAASPRWAMMSGNGREPGAKFQVAAGPVAAPSGGVGVHSASGFTSSGPSGPTMQNGGGAAAGRIFIRPALPNVKSRVRIAGLSTGPASGRNSAAPGVWAHPGAAALAGGGHSQLSGISGFGAEQRRLPAGLVCGQPGRVRAALRAAAAQPADAANHRLRLSAAGPHPGLQQPGPPPGFAVHRRHRRPLQPPQGDAGRAEHQPAHRVGDGGGGGL